VISIQLARLDALHEHSRSMPIVIVPVPPEGPNDVCDPWSDGWQRAPDPVGAVTLVDVELPQPASKRNNGRARTPARMTESTSCITFASHAEL
jgi:hypothetical protein